MLKSSMNTLELDVDMLILLSKIKKRKKKNRKKKKEFSIAQTGFTILHVVTRKHQCLYLGRGDWEQFNIHTHDKGSLSCERLHGGWEGVHVHVARDVLPCEACHYSMLTGRGPLGPAGGNTPV